MEVMYIIHILTLFAQLFVLLYLLLSLENVYYFVWNAC